VCELDSATPDILDSITIFLNHVGRAWPVEYLYHPLLSTRHPTLSRCRNCVAVASRVSESVPYSCCSGEPSFFPSGEPYSSAIK
jgi:hypothetical protein